VISQPWHGEVLGAPPGKADAILIPDEPNRLFRRHFAEIPGPSAASA
jgi:hypothetical protein